jgi:hypothetical protein
MTTLPQSFVPDETDVLAQKLDESLDDFAPLAARHEGQFGLWEHRRKMVLALAREAVRFTCAKAGEKISEARTDDLARVSLEYQAFIDEGEQERTEYHRQKNIRIEHYIRRRELEQRGMR